MKYSASIFIVFLGLASASSSFANNERRTWAFDVYLDDKAIGYHNFEIANEGKRTVLETEAEFDVKFLFVTAFRYKHSNTEIWSGGCLDEIYATTDNNGERLTVSGAGERQAFEVSSTRGEETLDGCVQSFAYWNPAILSADRLLNSQTGEYEAVDVQLVGEDLISVAGQDVPADRYRVSVRRGDIFLWYTKTDQTWVALDAPAKGKRRIRYQATDISNLKADQPAIAGTRS
ncbi:MAG: DUF6134 family protein [Woeseiaceae bacterium]|nr:DUF6134 family protein [Woeseiaceae bacterium]